MNYEVQAGYVLLADVPGGTSRTEFSVTFPSAMSAKPVVVVSNCLGEGGYYCSGLNYAVLPGSVTTSGFKIVVFNDGQSSTKWDTNTISYIAVVPKSTPTQTYLTHRTHVAPNNPPGVGSAKATALSSGKSIKLTNSMFWDLQGIVNGKNSSHKTLHDTYYT